MPGDLTKQLTPIVSGAVTAAGYELDALTVQQAGRRKLIKVIVDSDDGIAVDELATVNRAVAAELDRHDRLIAGAFTLEVTSPGLGRPLTTRRHWRRAHNRLVRITPHEGEEYVGRVGYAGEQTARVLVAGQILDVSYASVAKAVIEIEFKQPPAAELVKLGEDEHAQWGAESAAKAEQGHTGGKQRPEEPR